MATILKLLVVVVLLALFVLYNGAVIKRLASAGDSAERFIGRTLGRKLRQLDTYLEKQTVISNNRTYGTISSYYNEILVNLELKKERVTVPTFIAFIGILSLGVTGMLLFFTLSVILAFIGFFVSFYFITTIFNFVSLLRYERREGIIMDVEDLLAMGASRGIKNAITLYTPSFHPQIKPYFEDFLINIEFHGYSFEQSMLILNHNLGSGFSAFTRLAMQYEAKAEKGMEDIFSPIVVTNRRKREVRQTVNRKFSELRTNFIASGLAVFGFLAFMMITDMRASHLILNTTLGNLSLVSDAVLVTFVLAYITAIKAKFLK